MSAIAAGMESSNVTPGGPVGSLSLTCRRKYSGEQVSSIQRADARRSPETSVVGGERDFQLRRGDDQFGAMSLHEIADPGNHVRKLFGRVRRFSGVMFQVEQEGRFVRRAHIGSGAIAWLREEVGLPRSEADRHELLPTIVEHVVARGVIRA